MSLGASTGRPFVPIQQDSTFLVPLRINAGPQKLGGFSAMIYYETAALRPVSYHTEGVSAGGTYFVNFQYALRKAVCHENCRVILGHF